MASDDSREPPGRRTLGEADGNCNEPTKSARRPPARLKPAVPEASAPLAKQASFT